MSAVQRERSASASWLARAVQRSVLERLAALEEGELVVVAGGARTTFGRKCAALPEPVTLEVLDPEFWWRVALRGSIGAGESYMAGEWRASDLVLLVRLFARNRVLNEQVEGGLARLLRPLLRLAHARRRNDRDGARRNIADHYDLGNDFFALFLDPSMTYSCALFETPEQSLADAQRAKIERLCRRLELAPGDHLLEIGTGWGAFALHAAREHGCRVTTTTISRRQHELARERVRAAGLADRIDVRLEDYRDLAGTFDKVVSVEMVEAIGWRQFETYFAAIGRLLAPHGAAAIQSIVIADERYEAARDSVDFIQTHIFPGCCIPSVSALVGAAARASDLRLVALDEIGPHYARTLREWRLALLAQRPALARMGVPEQRIRAWEWYFAYCEGGFEERVLGDVQLRFDRPQCRTPPLLPPLPPTPGPRLAPTPPLARVDAAPR
ncbi:MAG: class I SAM-dependent methyltransferase [Planctomycetes bacterium]|nr:class I SAM-dependent methyltransferase [Planctomycetota bacterium]